MQLKHVKIFNFIIYIYLFIIISLLQYMTKVFSDFLLNCSFLKKLKKLEREKFSYLHRFMSYFYIYFNYDLLTNFQNV